jgi:hypothetical protein
MNGQFWSFQNGSWRGLPLPMHGSTTTVRPSVSTTNACTRMSRLPISGPAAGKNICGGMPSVSASTMLVIRVSPSFQLCVSSAMRRG